MRKIVLLFLIVVFVSIEGYCQTSKEVHVVLLAGQSNMAGAGNYDKLDDSLKERIKKISGRVFVSQSNTAQIPLTYYPNMPSEKYNFTNRFGPELFLGLTLAEANPNREYLLIKEAKGGTALYGAWNPDWTLEKAKEIEQGEAKQSWNLCEIHIKSIQKNLEILTSKGKKYKIIGMAWMQGENDAMLEKAAKSYRNNLQKLVEKYRTTFNVPEMPFVLGQINSRYGEEGAAEIVRDQMLKFSNSDYYSALIKTTTDTSWADFPKHSDNVHYNSEGQKRLGTAFATSLVEINKKLDVPFLKSKKQLKKNEILRFKAPGETNMIYNLLLPSNFKKNKKRPMLIAFSPNGNSRGILDKLKPKATELGWTLVTCDKLKNGIKDVVLEQKMEDEVLNEIFKVIPHDEKQIYLAGFSGGAMRCYGLSTRRPEKYAGILAFGGWLGGDDYQGKLYQKGMRVAIVNGDNDKGANGWAEKDAATLVKNNSIVKSFSFKGGHEIATEETISEAIDWMVQHKK